MNNRCIASAWATKESSPSYDPGVPPPREPRGRRLPRLPAPPRRWNPPALRVAREVRATSNTLLAMEHASTSCIGDSRPGLPVTENMPEFAALAWLRRSSKGSTTAMDFPWRRSFAGCRTSSLVNGHWVHPRDRRLTCRADCGLRFGEIHLGIPRELCRRPACEARWGKDRANGARTAYSCKGDVGR